MKLIFKANESDLTEIAESMRYLSKDESMVIFGQVKPSLGLIVEGGFSETAVQWQTTGGNSYIVDAEKEQLVYLGSRTRLNAGSLFGHILRDEHHNYAIRVTNQTNPKANSYYLEFPLDLVSMETSWKDVPGCDDPFCMEDELRAKQQSMMDDQNMTYIETILSN